MTASCGCDSSLDWLRQSLTALAYVRNDVRQPQLDVFGEADENVNMLGRRAMRRLTDAVSLDLRIERSHHSPLFDNPLFRALGLDDGYWSSSFNTAFAFEMSMTPTCRICAQPTRHVFDLHTSRHEIDVPVYLCAACRAYWSDGGPVDYDDVDLRSYYLPYADAIRERYRRVFSHLERRIATGRLMDIGAGMGFSLEVATRRGWSAKGLEPNRALAEHAQRQGLDVVNAYLADDTPGSFDVVLIDNVLEHVPDPMTFLRNASRLLAPGAMMVVAIPPLDWLRRQLAASAYVRDHVRRPQLNVFAEADEHVNMLGRRAMGRLADGVGLDLLADRFHHSPLFDNPLFRALGLDDGYYFIKHR